MHPFARNFFWTAYAFSPERGSRAYYSGRVESNLGRIDTFLEKSTVLSIDRLTASHYASIRSCGWCGRDYRSFLTASHYASIRRLLRLKGKPIPENDVWIAALAATQPQSSNSGQSFHFDRWPEG
jgi:predicted nucleic acid-binding protein